MSRQFKKTQIATYVCIALSSLASANAIAADKDKKALDDIEVIQVSGIRSSLTSALNTKRGAETISDSIIAEEIGKSSDENIAQALSRVSGVLFWLCSITLLSPISCDQNLFKIIFCGAFSKPSEITW